MARPGNTRKSITTFLLGDLESIVRKKTEKDGGNAAVHALRKEEVTSRRRAGIAVSDIFFDPDTRYSLHEGRTKEQYLRTDFSCCNSRMDERDMEEAFTKRSKSTHQTLR
jgi:hypothetical protein